MNLFSSSGYSQIDTAFDYRFGPNDGSESRLGAAGAASRFTIHTKVHSGEPGAHQATNIEKSIKQSLEELKMDSVETMFLHVPDRDTPFEESAKAMDKAYKEGKFRKFGLSNYAPEEVQKFIDICQENGYVKPSVYQGGYNPIVRAGEKHLFPILRKNGMAFFAYSPTAGGLFTGNSATATRWSTDNQIGQVYNMIYSSPAVKASVEEVMTAAKKHGLSGHEAALRWTMFHSVLDGKYGDGVLFGYSKLDHVRQSMEAYEKGPLPKDLADALTAVHASFEGHEIAFHL